VGSIGGAKIVNPKQGILARRMVFVQTVFHRRLVPGLILFTSETGTVRGGIARTEFEGEDGIRSGI